MIAAMRLARAAARARWRSGFLVALVFLAASASAVTGLAARSALSDPWDQVFEGSNGAHVRITASSHEEARRVASAIPGVVETDDSRRFGFGSMRTDLGTFPLALLVSTSEPVMDRPVVVDQAEGDLALEYSLAEALGLKAGDAVSLQRADGTWVATRVGSVVSSVVTPPYPDRVPGLGFLNSTDVERLGLAEPGAVSLGLRVQNPSNVESLEGSRPDLGIEASTWSDVRSEAVSSGQPYQVILDSFSVLLLACATSLVAVTIGGQLIVDRRLFELLSAAGSTPAQTAAAAALEHAFAAALGAVGGVTLASLGAGSVLASAGPNVGPSTTGIGTVQAIAVVIVIVLAAVVISWSAAYRTARRLADANVSDVRSESRIGRWAVSRRLPASIVIGVKDAFSRRARAAMAVVVVLLAVVAVVAALNMEATFASEHNRLDAVAGSESDPLEGALPGPDFGNPISSTDEDRLRPLVYGLELLLVIVAGSTIVLATSLDSKERRSESAAQLAIGVTPCQLASARAAATTLTAGLGTAVGIPVGIGFFVAAYTASNGTGEGATVASPITLLLGSGLLLLVTVLSAWVTTFASQHVTSLPAMLRSE